MKEKQSLLPCPFCGGNVNISCKNENKPEYYITCRCGIKLSNFHHKNENVIIRWNTRTPIIQQSLSGSGFKKPPRKSCKSCIIYGSCDKVKYHIDFYGCNDHKFA